MRFVGPPAADGRLVVDIVVGGPLSRIPAHPAGRIGHRLKAQIGRRGGRFEDRRSLARWGDRRGLVFRAGYEWKYDDNKEEK